jgi:hypothetical protein
VRPSATCILSVSLFDCGRHYRYGTELRSGKWRARGRLTFWLDPIPSAGAEWSESSMSFFTSSHLSLDGAAPIPFGRRSGSTPDACGGTGVDEGVFGIAQSPWRCASSDFYVRQHDAAGADRIRFGYSEFASGGSRDPASSAHRSQGHPRGQRCRRPRARGPARAIRTV